MDTAFNDGFVSRCFSQVVRPSEADSRWRKSVVRGNPGGRRPEQGERPARRGAGQRQLSGGAVGERAGAAATVVQQRQGPGHGRRRRRRSRQNNPVESSTQEDQQHA